MRVSARADGHARIGQASAGGRAGGRCAQASQQRQCGERRGQRPEDCVIAQVPAMRKLPMRAMHARAHVCRQPDTPTATPVQHARALACVADMITVTTTKNTLTQTHTHTHTRTQTQGGGEAPLAYRVTRTRADRNNTHTQNASRGHGRGRAAHNSISAVNAESDAGSVPEMRLSPKCLRCANGRCARCAHLQHLLQTTRRTHSHT